MSDNIGYNLASAENWFNQSIGVGYSLADHPFIESYKKNSRWVVRKAWNEQ